ncbi:sialate O-acetylesterase [Singulisphaera sp. PoT]|uniref:sialate O-acetylesterase n=1 Tax=Singulisphaera sp. PoT TaxID=3411797 RepID=UPI003BF494E9
MKSVFARGLFRLAGGLLVLGAGVVQPASAEVKLPNIFTEHMVLQRGQNDKVWGWAKPGEEVTVTIEGQAKSSKADDKGKWAVTLDPLKAGGPFTLTIKGENTITFSDVLVGEVWVCSGQSNMQWPVLAANDGELEIMAAKYPKIRLISVPQVGTQEPKENFEGAWKACTPETVGNFSAVGFFFGRQLHETLRVPVGLINDAWGGSACEAWINREKLTADGRFKELLAHWELREKKLPEAKAAYQKALAEWKAEAEKAKAEGKKPSPAPHDPEAEMHGNHRPGNIYNGVLRPTIGYGIKGAIWYQGESNASRGYQYRDLFPFMIKLWREEWGIGDFPFYWVQLADFMAEKPTPSDSAWAELREAQTMTMSKLPNTGEAVIIDLGEANDIHPRNKQRVAMRLARWALAKDYGIRVAHQSPTYKSFEKQGNKIVLTFDHVGSGLRTIDVSELNGFAVAGVDKKFVWAKAKFVGNDKVEVWADSVSEPTAVRYAWADNPVCNVLSKEGLPLTPFRTDDWPGVTINMK